MRERRRIYHNRKSNRNLKTAQSMGLVETRPGRGGSYLTEKGFALVHRLIHENGI